LFTALLIFAGFFQLHSQNAAFVPANQSTSTNGNTTNNQAHVAGVSNTLSSSTVQAGTATPVSSVTLDQDAIAAGGLLSGKIYISEDATSMLNSNQGVVINIKFNPAVLDPNSFQIDFGNSNLGTLQVIVNNSGNSQSGEIQIQVKKKDSSEKLLGHTNLAFKYVVTDDLAGFRQSDENHDNVEVMGAKLIPISVNSKVVYVQLLPPTTLNTASLNNNPILPEASISLYPNPARNTITVNSGTYSGSTFQVYNMSGQILKTIIAPLGSTQSDIDIADLSVGIYILKMNTPQGQVMKKFSKTN